MLPVDHKEGDFAEFLVGWGGARIISEHNVVETQLLPRQIMAPLRIVKNEAVVVLLPNRFFIHLR